MRCLDITDNITEIHTALRAELLLHYGPLNLGLSVHDPSTDGGPWRLLWEDGPHDWTSVADSVITDWWPELNLEYVAVEGEPGELMISANCWCYDCRG